MRKYLLLFIVGLLVSNYFVALAQPIEGTIVSKYYLTFFPAYQENEDDSLNASVLISSFSNYETNVSITIKSRNFVKNITLAPFSSQEINIDASDAFPLQRKPSDAIA